MSSFFLNQFKKFICIITLAPLSYLTYGQTEGNGVADEATEFVNPYTGDFSYSVPVCVVPGPNGEDFPIIANYNAGIGMDQMSSWLGLGWSMHFGEISRKVNGAPDDWLAVIVQKKTSAQPLFENTHEIYGPLYFDECHPNPDNSIGSANPNGAKVMDVYSSYYKLQGGAGSPFMFPDYDQYTVVSPDMGGEMQPYIFQYGNLVTEDIDNNIDFIGEITDFGDPYDKVKFRMKDDNTRIFAPYYSDGVNIADLGHDPDPLASFIPPLHAPFEQYTSNCNTDNTNLWSEYHIEYLTNAQINAPSATCTLATQGFYNLKVTNPTATCASFSLPSHFPPHGIGAFKVTAPNGFTYHYTLPVYSSNELITTFEVNNDYDVDQFGNTEIFKRAEPYANTWKLTAITGPDYVDDGDAMTDEGDKGYWISLEYGKWIDAYKVKYPYTDYAYDVETSKLYHGVESWENPNKYNGKGTIIDSDCEIYYINKIKTATHTAFFVKDIKKDDHDIDGANKRPTLRLSHVILMANEDIGSIFSTNSALENTAGFFTADVHKDNIIHEGSYLTYFNTIKPLALQIVDFTHDYSLCPFYTRNVNCTTTGAVVSINHVEYKEFESVVHSGNVLQSGKLTLNKMVFHQENYAHLFGDYQFNYGSGVKNPHYHPWMKDFWGMYKSDFDTDYRGNYTTPGSNGSHNNVDAWSMTKVTDPLKGELEVAYESDEYEWTGDHFSLLYSGLKRPTRLFMIRDIDNNGNTSLSNLSVQLFDKDLFSYTPLIGTSDISKYAVAMRFAGTPSSCTTSSAFDDCLASPHFGGTLYYNQNPTIGFLSATPPEVGVTGTSFLSVGCANFASSCGWTGFDYISSAGYIKFDLTKAHGGGIRVKTITTKDPYTNSSYKLKYSYDDGICTNEPDRFGQEKIRGILLSNAYNRDKHAPSPNVGYTFVTVEAEGDAGIAGNKNGKVRYKLQNYVMDHIANVKDHFELGSCLENEDAQIAQIMHVGEHNLIYGAVLREEIYDKENNLVKLTENEFRPMRTEDGFNTGRVDEIFYSHYRLNECIEITGSITSGIPNVRNVYYKTQYNYALSKTTVTIDGLISSTEFRDRDILTGTPTTIISNDPTYGDRTTQIQMAWNQPSFLGIGPKSVNTSYANILEAVHKTDVFRGLPGPTSTYNMIESSKTDYSNFSTANKYIRFNTGTGRYFLGTNPNSFTIWGNDKTYAWVPTTGLQSNGLFVAGTGGFWKTLEETSIRNKTNQIVEAKVLDKRFSSVKMGYNDKYPIAEINDANYLNFAYSGFESTQMVEGQLHFDSEVQNGLIKNENEIVPHTGDFVAKVSTEKIIYKSIVSADNGGIYIEKDGGTDAGMRTFRFSIWAYSKNNSAAAMKVTIGLATYIVTNGDANAVTVGDWKKLTLDVPISTVTTGAPVQVSLLNGVGNAFFDDFRFHPIDAPMLSYVYDDRTGRVTHMLDVDNYYTRYEYDNAGRVTNTFQETPPEGTYLGGEKKVSTAVYHIHQ